MKIVLTKPRLVILKHNCNIVLFMYSNIENSFAYAHPHTDIEFIASKFIVCADYNNIMIKSIKNLQETITMPHIFEELYPF